MQGKILIICGCTGVGKSNFALFLSNYLNMEIVSADSMQIYKSVDLGTSKPTSAEKKICKHHLVDIVSPFDSFNVFQYTRVAQEAIEKIWAKGKLPVIVGGTGLYIESLIKNYEFKTKRTSQNNIYEYKLICLNRDREKMYGIINERVDKMIDNGLIDEVKTLRSIGINSGNQCMKAIGYKEIWEYLDDKVCMDDAIDNIKRNTRNYAKRQITWFKHMDCEWYDIDSQKEELIDYILKEYNEYKK